MWRERLIDEFEESVLAFLDSLPSLVFISDLKDRRILFANRALIDAFGDDVIGKTCCEAIHGGDDCPCNIHSDDASPKEDGDPAAELDPELYEEAFSEFKSVINDHWYSLYRKGMRWKDGSLVNLAIANDISRKKQDERAEVMRNDRNKSLADLGVMSGATVKELCDYALDSCVYLTQSKFGNLYFYDEDTKLFTLYSWSRDVMKQCAIKDKNNVYELDNTGLWGEAVRQRQPIVTNDYKAPNPYVKSYPDGHVQILRHMSIPVFSGGRIVAVVGMANKDNPYTADDVYQLTMLMQGVWQIIERRQYEDSLQDMVRAEEKLVREMNHRVKNSLNMIQSLLGLTAMSMDEGEAREALDASQARVLAVGMIHERLYKKTKGSNIDFSEYAESLATRLIRTSSPDDETLINLSLELEPLVLDVETAMPCGLILNELLINSLKHAFPKDRRGEITVRIANSAHGLHTLSITDNGVGLPEEFDPKQTGALGMKIVEALVHQVSGEMEILRSTGTRIVIRFREDVPDDNH